MADPRWTEETRDLVARAVCVGGGHGDSPVAEAHHWQADAVLAALADAGLLVEPGAKTHVEWAVYHGNVRLSYGSSWADALAEVAAGHGALWSRTIHTGPWREA